MVISLCYITTGDAHRYIKNMSTRVKNRKKFDVLVSRILFFELAISFLAVDFFIMFINSDINPFTIFLGVLFTILGLFCLYSCCLLDDSKVKNWAEKTGSHEILIVFVGLAFCIASILRRCK